MSTPTESPKLVPVHGLLSTPLEFVLVARAPGACGIAIEALEVPGYTLADRKKPMAWKSWLEAATAAFNERVPPEQPVVIPRTRPGLCKASAAARTAPAHRPPNSP